MYFINLFKELRKWYLLYKLGKKHEKMLNENGIRRDYIGRLYSVINLPEEVANHPYQREPYVLEHLREYDQILLKAQLTELVYPEISAIPESDAYLLVLDAGKEYISLSKFLFNILIYGSAILIIRFLFNFFGLNIVELFKLFMSHI